VVAMWVIAPFRRILNIKRVPILGVAVVVMTALLALLRRPLPGAVLVGVGLLLLLPFFAPSQPDQRWRVAAAVPGAAVIAFLAPSGEGGLELLALVAIPVLGGLVASFDQAHLPSSFAAIGLASATGAALLSLPDTQNIAAMAGIAAVVGIGAFLSPTLALGVSVYPWMGLLMWIVMADGSARPAGAVGTIGALSFVVIEPVVRTLLQRKRGTRQIGRGLLIRPAETSVTLWTFMFAVAQGGVALLSARLAGTSHSTLLALAIVTGIWMLLGAGLAALGDGESA